MKSITDPEISAQMCGNLSNALGLAKQELERLYHEAQKKGHPDLATKELARIAVINKTISRCSSEILLAVAAGI